MNVAEERLKGFIEHMCEVIFELLSPLNCEKVVTGLRDAAHIFFVVSVVSVAEFVGRVLQLQTHIAADSSTARILLHMRPHFIDGIQFGLYSHIGEDAVLGIEQFAEPFEKEHVR